jgi:hypothetical protein
MKAWKIVITISVILLGCSFAQAEMTDKEKAIQLERYQNTLRKLETEANVTINFYGKIEDQNGDPVVDAEVEYGITSYSVVNVLDVSTGFAISDSGGNFEIRNKTGASLSIREVRLKGYSYSPRQNPKTGFDYWADLEVNRFLPNENEPIVFYVRKQGEIAFTIKADSLMSKDIDFGKVFYGSLKDGRVWPSDHPRFKFQRDFEMVAQKREGQDPILTIATFGDYSGIILSDENIFTAPASGYSTSLEFPCVKGEKYFFFMKNKDGLYARIEGKFRSREPNAQEVRTYLTLWLNPYGDRNLETDSDIPVEIWIQLEKEARAAFRDNKIPEKPDLQQLVNGQ